MTEPATLCALPVDADPRLDPGPVPQFVPGLVEPMRTGVPCWVDLVADVPVATRFYSALFGWLVDIEPCGRAVCYLGGREVAGLRQRIDRSRCAAWVPSMCTPDLAATASSVERAGGQVRATGPVATAVDDQGAVFGLREHDPLRCTGVADQLGTLVWSEHRSPHITEAKAFYHNVFGYLYQTAGPPGYTTFLPGEGGMALGGLGRTAGQERAGWHSYFCVANTDDTVATALDLGATVPHPPENGPFGRVATITDNQGATFAVVSASVT